jgi:hypothetical protein
MSTIGSDYNQDYDRRAKEREQSREAKLEKNTQSTLQRKDAETERTVRNVKDDYQTSMNAQAKADRLDRERFKQATYDRSGRQSNAVENSANTDRDRAVQAAAAADARSAKAISDSEAYQQQQASEADQRHQNEMEALADSYRKQIADARGDESDDDRQATQEYRKKLSADSQTAIRQAQEEVVAVRRQAKLQAEQSEVVLKDRDRKADNLLNTRLHEKDLSTKAALNQNAEAERSSRAREFEPLREQVMATAGIERDVAKTKNEARAGAIKELESDWNSKYENQSLSHDLEKQKLRADVSNADRVYGQKLGGYMKENDAKTTRIIANQNADHRDQMSMTAKEYDRSLEHVKIQAGHDKQLSEQLLSHERQNATEHQDRALATQAATYQETIANQRQSQQAQIQNLERVLNNKNSTSDAGEISAGAEQTVRAAVSKQYDKTFQAEADRNSREREHLGENYRSNLGDAIRDKQQNTTALNRQNVKEQTVMRNEFVQHVSDVEENKRQMLNLASDANLKMSETTSRNNGRQLNEMRRHYEDLLATQADEHGKQSENLRSQSEFEKRAMRRDFQTQSSDMIRSYQKQIADQKVASDEENRDLKAKLDTKTRESDKHLAQALAEQARGYDHRMAELEAQSKDRERLTAQQHEDELDRVKKSNALLLSKKG